MKQLSSIESKVKALVDAFFSDKITAEEFRQELAEGKVRFKRKERKLPKSRGKTFS